MPHTLNNSSQICKFKKTNLTRDLFNERDSENMAMFICVAGETNRNIDAMMYIGGVGVFMPHTGTHSPRNPDISSLMHSFQR